MFQGFSVCFCLHFAVAAAAALGQTNLSEGRMTGSGWSTGAEVSGNRRKRTEFIRGQNYWVKGERGVLGKHGSRCR